MGKRSREKRERRLGLEKEQKKEKSEIGLERILKGIIFVGTSLILFTPLILSGKFFFPFVGPKSLYFMGLVEIIFFTWLFLIIFNPKYRPRFNLILGSLILFLIVLIISASLGVDPSYSFWSKFERMTGILMMAHLFAFFLVIFTVFKEKDWIKLFSVSIFVGVILSFIALTSKEPAMRGGATIGNDSFLGTYLIFNLFLALYLIFKSKGGLKLYSSICFLFIALVLLLSGAQAAKLSFFGGLILFFFLWLIFCQKGKLRWAGVSLLLLSIILSLSFLYFSFQSESFVRKGIIDRVVGETFGGRFVVWEGGWKGFLERPILGWGLENFEFSFIKHYNPCMGTSRCGSDIWYDRAHNIIFDTLVTSGILGLLSYFLIFIAAFYLLWRNYLKGNFDFWQSGIFTALLISYSVQNLTVFDMVSSYMIFFLVLGFIANLSKAETRREGENIFNQKERVSSKRRILVPLMAILILIPFSLSFSKFVIQPLQTDYYVIVALQKEPASKEKIEIYKKTLEASPLGKYQIREFFAQRTLESIRAEKEIPGENFRPELDFISAELEKGIKESPLDFRSYLRLGQIYNSYILIDPTKISQAEEVLEKAIEVSPTNQQGYWTLAQTKIYQGEFETAFSLAEKALALEPNLFQSHFIVIQIAKFMGDEDLVQRKAREAIEINPDWEADIKKILES